MSYSEGGTSFLQSLLCFLCRWLVSGDFEAILFLVLVN